MDFAKTLRTITDFLNQQRIDFALIGGLAMAAYGLQRMTSDIDLVLPSKAAPFVIPFPESSGYETVYRSEAFSHHHPPLPGLVR